MWFLNYGLCSFHDIMWFYNTLCGLTFYYVILSLRFVVSSLCYRSALLLNVVAAVY